MTRPVLFELFVTNLLLFEHQQQQQKNMLVSWQFSGTYGVTKYGSGWRKDVVNQCLEFDKEHVFLNVQATLLSSSTAPGNSRHSWRPYSWLLAPLLHQERKYHIRTAEGGLILWLAPTMNSKRHHISPVGCVTSWRRNKSKAVVRDWWLIYVFI